MQDSKSLISAWVVLYSELFFLVELQDRFSKYQE